jgi:hypothetical protein
MVSRHDHGSTVGHHCLNLPPERSARRTVHTRERLIQQEQIRLAHPRASEQYTTQLPVWQLPQRSLLEIGEAEKRERASGGRPIGRGRRIIQADTRVTSRLHDLRHGQVLRVICLQMWRYEPYTTFEYLERHARLDANTLYPAANRDPMVTI